MKIKNYVLLAPFIFIIFSCKGFNIFKSNNDIFEDCIDDSRVNDQVFCIEIYDPVCGCNDKTYPNSCYAEREGVIEWSKGVCK